MVQKRGRPLLPPDRGNNVGGGYPAGVSGTSRVFCRRIAGNGSVYHRDFFMLLRFCCLSVLHAPNVGVVNFHRLWCVFGPFYFLFMHHNFLNEEPQQLRCQRLNVRVPLRFVEEAVRSNRRFPQALDLTLFLWNTGGVSRPTRVFSHSGGQGMPAGVKEGCTGPDFAKK